MAINKNHLFDDLNGVKCSIVETDATQARVDFLKSLLEYNHYNVVVVTSPPPKAAKAPVESETHPEEKPATFTIGVTDLMFNPTNAIFGRFLKIPGNKIVTQAYWNQEDLREEDATIYKMTNE